MSFSATQKKKNTEIANMFLSFFFFLSWLKFEATGPKGQTKSGLKGKQLRGRTGTAKHTCVKVSDPSTQCLPGCVLSKHTKLGSLNR